MAWVTQIISVERGEYRLVQSAGCGLAAEARAADPALSQGQGISEGEERELALAHDQALAYRMEDRDERPLTWVGRGLGVFGLAEGAALLTEADKDAARALLAGQDPRDGTVLVKPKVAAHPNSLLPAVDYLEALRRVADSRGVTVSGLTESAAAVKRIGRLERGVTRDASHLVPVQDLEALATSTGVGVGDVYLPEPLELARSYSDARVSVGIRGYEISLDLPKSFSVFFGLADTALSQEMEELWAGVATESVAALEEWAAYGMSGKSGDGHVATRVDTAGLSGWIMWHSVARPVDGQTPDPHLHAHVVLANLVHGEDGGWYVPGNGGREFYRHIKAIGALTQARARYDAAAKLGLTYEQDSTTGAWEIVGIGRDLRDPFSKRTGQTIAQLVKEGLDPDAATTAQAKAAAAKTRQAKPADGNRVGLRTSWEEQSAGLGVNGKAHMAGLVAPGYVRDQVDVAELGTQIFNPEGGLTSHRKQIDRTDLLAAIAQAPAAAWAISSIPRAQDLVDDVLTLPVCPVVVLPRANHILTNNDRYTTPDILAAELTGLAAARSGYGGDYLVMDPDLVERACRAFQVMRGFELSAEQKQAVTRLLTSGHAVDALVGVAGSGKTVLMQAIHEAIHTDPGLEIRGVSTAAVAAAGLQAETGIPSATIASLLAQIEHGDGLTGVHALIVEEAAMVDDRALATILHAAQQAHTKVIMIGDHMQLRAIGVGGLFKAIHEQVDGLTLHENRRQRDPGDQRALALWRLGKREDALAEWARNGHIHAGEEPADTLAALISEWQRTREQMYGEHGPAMDVHEELSRLLILAKSHADVTELNLAARELRRDAGEIVGDDRIYRRRDGTSLALAVGDHVWCRQNDYRSRGKNADPGAVDVLNGYRGKIIDMRDKDGAVLVEWRRLTPGGGYTPEATWITAKYIQAGGLTYGTALTVASAQGQTCDTALVYGLHLDGHEFYAAMSRARDRTELYLPRVTLENDVDRLTWGPPASDEHARFRAIDAFSRGLDDPHDSLVAAELGLVSDPIAHQDQPPPAGPDPRQQVAAELARSHQILLQQLGDRTPAPEPGPRHQEEEHRLAAREPGETEAAAVVRQQPQIMRWQERPLGHLGTTWLTKRLGQLHQEAAHQVDDLERQLTDAYAELHKAQGGGGDYVAKLHALRTELEDARDAVVRVRPIEAQKREAAKASSTMHTEIWQKQEMLERNPIYLWLFQNTTRRQLTKEIADLRQASTGMDTREIELWHQIQRLRPQAHHPHDPQAASSIVAGIGPGATRNDQANDRNDQAVLTSLRTLMDNWQDRYQAAHDGDTAAADVKVDIAQAHLQQGGSPATHHEISEINTELQLRSTLTPRQTAHENQTRAEHKRQQAEQHRIQREAERQRQQEQQQHLHQRYNPGIDPPGHGFSR